MTDWARLSRDEHSVHSVQLHTARSEKLAASECAVCCLQAASQIGVGASGDGKWLVGRTGVHVLLDDGKD